MNKHNPVKILIVDDEPDSTILVQSILEHKGYKVATAYDGLSALDLIGSDRPDLILLDLLMPVMDGYEVCAKLKTEHATRAIPVIIFTAANNVSLTRKALAIGADDYVVKPFEINTLIEKIEAFTKKKDSR